MKTLVFDGNNAAWRLMKKLPQLTSRGEQVQVVYGFLRLVRSMLEQFQPDAALVCWDSGRSKERMQLYPEYKANRDHDSSADLRREMGSVNKQIHRLKEILPKLNVMQSFYPDTEADDLMGISTEALPGEKVIVSSDRDAYHLIDEQVSVWSPIKLEHYTHKNFAKKVIVKESGQDVPANITPQQWLEMRALTGDSGDNISGVARGFGEGSALELIRKFDSIEKLFTAPIEEKIHDTMASRYALIYSAGARERVYRNLLLMDLRLPIRRPRGPKIAELMKKGLGKRQRVDKLAVRAYFREHDFDSLTKDFVVWISPFTDLDS